MRSAAAPASTRPAAATRLASTDPACTRLAATDFAAMEPAHRTKARRALRSQRARPELTVERGVRLRPGRLPTAADPLLEARGR